MKTSERCSPTHRSAGRRNEERKQKKKSNLHYLLGDSGGEMIAVVFPVRKNLSTSMLMSQEKMDADEVSTHSSITSVMK